MSLSVYKPHVVFVVIHENLKKTSNSYFKFHEKTIQQAVYKLRHPLKSKFYKKRGATFFYDITRKSGPLDFTQYRSKSSSF